MSANTETPNKENTAQKKKEPKKPSKKTFMDTQNFDETLSGISGLIDDARKSKIEENFDIKYIHFKDIVPNKKNGYDLNNIEELAKNIEKVGLQHNLVVREIEKGKGKYEIISGHRRFAALNRIKDETYRSIPCKVIDVDELDGELELILTNALTRVVSEKENLWQIGRLHEIYDLKKKNDKTLKGRVRELVAAATGMSETQVGRYYRIYAKGTEQLKQAVCEKAITIANANEIALADEETQNKMVEIFYEKVSLNKEETRELLLRMQEAQSERDKLLAEKNETGQENQSLTEEEIEKIKQSHEENTSQITSAYTDTDEETLIIRKKFKSPSNSLQRTVKWIEKTDTSNPEFRTELESFVKELNHMTEHLNKLLKQQ